MDNIETEIVSIISEVSGLEPEEITFESKFIDDLDIDSIKAIEIAVALEKHFKISVRDEDIPNIGTVQQAVDIVKKILSQKEDDEAEI